MPAQLPTLHFFRSEETPRSVYYYDNSSDILLPFFTCWDAWRDDIAECYDEEIEDAPNPKDTLEALTMEGTKLHSLFYSLIEEVKAAAGSSIAVFVTINIINRRITVDPGKHVNIYGQLRLRTFRQFYSKRKE
jgi:hypothetical protein